ncbi:MAG: hypothetical protein FWC55_07990 [Firmicutes bacterium]|nr:hypothetical protein [Bacillota bacterium]
MKPGVPKKPAKEPATPAAMLPAKEPAMLPATLTPAAKPLPTDLRFPPRRGGSGRAQAPL